MTHSPYSSFPRLDWATLEHGTSHELRSLAMVWRERKSGLAASGALSHTINRLQREWAVETGLVDQLYSWERGVTDALMEYGVDAGTIEMHGGAYRGQAERISHIIQDQFGVIAGLMDFVRGQKPLTESYIRSLHSHFTRHQDTAEVLLGSGEVANVVLSKGEYKKVQDYTRREDGSLVQYCPPGQVPTEMSQLIAGYHEWSKAAPPEVLAAWIHHALVRIHPFQDANGRVARALSTLVFLQAGLFPLVIRLSDRREYLSAIRAADDGSIQPLVTFFAQRQRDTILEALGTPRATEPKEAADHILSAAVHALQRKKSDHEVRLQQVFDVAQSLHDYSNQEFETLAHRVDNQIRPLSIAGEPYHADSRSCTADQRASHYYFRELVRTARVLRYYANTQVHRSWVRIAIETEEVFYFVLSFHSIGQHFEGVLGASAFTFQRMQNEEGGRDVANLRPACNSVFQFNYLEDQSNVQGRFKVWLDRAVAVALDNWRLTLGA